MEILAEGTGEYFRPDPDGFRTWVREHKPRTLVNKLMGEREEVKHFVTEGEHTLQDEGLTDDSSGYTREPRPVGADMTEILLLMYVAD